MKDVKIFLLKFSWMVVSKNPNVVLSKWKTEFSDLLNPPDIVNTVTDIPANTLMEASDASEEVFDSIITHD